MVEAQFIPYSRKFVKLIRMSKSFNSKMVTTGLQVLPQRQHLYVVRTQVLHDFDDFVIGFPQTEH